MYIYEINYNFVPGHIKIILIRVLIQNDILKTFIQFFLNKKVVFKAFNCTRLLASECS